MIIIYYVDVFFQIKKNMFLIVMNLVIESRGFGYTQTTTLRRVFIIAKTGPSSVDAATCLFDFLGDVTADVDVKRSSCNSGGKAL